MNYYNIIPDFWQILSENLYNPGPWSVRILPRAYPMAGGTPSKPPLRDPESDKQESMDHTSKLEVLDNLNKYEMFSRLYQVPGVKIYIFLLKYVKFYFNGK